MTRVYSRGARDNADELGLSIVEVVMALTIFALIIVGIAASTGAGLRLTNIANGRQQATEVAVEYLERLRATDFASLGHFPVDATVFNGGPGTPDEDVDLSTGTYDSPVDDAPPGEELVALTAGGIEHFEEMSVGSREFDIYAFVTWADETQGQKRATVVIRYAGTDARGRPNEVAMSSVYVAGQITHRASGATSSTSSSSTSSTSSTTTTLATCLGDASGPTFTRFEILDSLGADGVRYITSRTVAIAVGASDPCTPVRISLAEGSPAFGSSSALAADPDSVGFTIASTTADGSVTLYGQVADGAGNVNGTPRSDTVVLDTQSPSSATGLAGVIKNSGQVDLTWSNSAVDPAPGGGVAKYVVFRRVGAEPAAFVAIGTVTIGSGTGNCRANAATCSFSDATVTSQSYTYRVVAVDMAGNSSGDSNEEACVVTPTSKNVDCT